MPHELDPEAPPTVQEVQTVLEERRAYRRPLIDEVRRDLEMYYQEYDIDVPEDFHVVKPPQSNSLVNRLADRLGSGLLQIHMEPRTGGEEERQRVEKVEKALKALFWLMRKRAKYNPIRALGLHGFNRGAAVAKIQVDADAYPPRPESADTKHELSRALKRWEYERQNRFPLVFDARPIESIYPDSETEGEHDVIEYYQRRVGDVRKNYPGWDGWMSGFRRGRDARGRYEAQRGLRDDDRVRYTEFWTQRWRGAMVDEQWLPIGRLPAGPVKNEYGRPPYFLRYSGFGDPAGEVHQRCVSVIRAARDAFRSLARVTSIIDSVAENEAYGALVGQSDDSGIEGFMFAPGHINPMDYPEKVKELNAKGVNPSLLAVQQMLSQMVETGSVPAEAIGQPSSGRRAYPNSGVLFAMLTGTSSMIIDPVKGMVEDILSDILPFVLYLFDGVIEDELPISGQVGENEFVKLTLKPGVIDAHYGPVYVELKLRQPEEDYARWNLGIQAMSNGLPPEFVMERFFGVENSHAMVREMMKKRLAYSGPVLEYLSTRLVEMLRAAETAGANALPPPPGARVPAPSNAQVPKPEDLSRADPLSAAQIRVSGTRGTPGGPVPVAG